jgi:hypothetical protein
MGTGLVEARGNETDRDAALERFLGRSRGGLTASRKFGTVLWTIQALLALLFLFAGGTKLAMPADMLAVMTPLPVMFMKFIGIVEVLGGLGLVLPGLTRIRPGPTPLAAAGLTVEMIGATATTVAIGGGAAALMPFVVGLLAAFVAYGRWRR